MKSRGGHFPLVVIFPKQYLSSIPIQLQDNFLFLSSMLTEFGPATRHFTGQLKWVSQRP